jgi:hypothetical protein
MLNLNPASQPFMPMKHTGIGLRVNGMAVLALASFSLFAIASEASPAATTALNGSMTGAAVAPYVRDAFVHDPSTLIKCKDEFWVFATGRGVPSWHSKDLVNWEHGPSVFTSNAPPWVAEAVPANRPLGYWAPDLTYLNGRYLLYYSASTFLAIMFPASVWSHRPRSTRAIQLMAGPIKGSLSLQPRRMISMRLTRLYFMRPMAAFG